MVERRSFKPKVVGSSPTFNICDLLFALVAQQEERQIEDLSVRGSIPCGGTKYAYVAKSGLRLQTATLGSQVQILS